MANKYRPITEDNNASIYCTTNKYGYKLNVNHKDIQPLYFRFKRWKGINDNAPLPDALRHEFEQYLLKEKQL